MRHVSRLDELSRPPRAGMASSYAAGSLVAQAAAERLRRQWPRGAPREATWAAAVAEGLTVEQMAGRWGLSVADMQRVHDGYMAVIERRRKHLQS